MYYLLLVVEFICILFFARKPIDLCRSSDQTYGSENLDYMSIGFINEPHFEYNKHSSSPEIYNKVTLFKIWSFLFLSVTKICNEVKQSYLFFHNCYLPHLKEIWYEKSLYNFVFLNELRQQENKNVNMQQFSYFLTFTYLLNYLLLIPAVVWKYLLTPAKKGLKANKT